MDKINQAARILNQGGIIIYPTDTAFAIGCRIDKDESVRKLFDIRNRPLEQAVPVLVKDKEMALEYFENFSKEMEVLMINFWPGQLTIVERGKTEVPEQVRGGGATVGLRVPDFKITLSLIRKVGVGILGPSANFHGDITPFFLKDLNKALVKKVDFVLESETGGNKVSTVIDCSEIPFKILREGSVTKSDIQNKIKNLEII